MVRCPDCETPNSVDSKFCKFCGAALPEEELVGAQVKLTELLNEGYRIFNEGRTEEAGLVADSALEASPTSTQGLSLKAMCFERTGELAEALELYEKVVQLNPESALDKIKVTHLRNQLNAKVIEVPPTTRRTALLAGIATVVLVGTVGAILAATMGGNKTPVAQKSDTPSGLQEVAFNRPNTTAATQQQQSTNTQLPSTSTGSVVFPPQIVGEQRIPVANDNGFKPVIVGDINPNSNPTGTSNTKPVEKPEPTNPTNTVDLPPEPEKPKEDTGTIEITVHRGNDRASGGGSDSASRPNELKVLLRTASDQFMLGNFESAAKTYSRAIQAGGDRATLNQRIGQCYANLGRTNEAINAYTKAVDAYKEALTRSNSPVLRSGLDSCQKALKLLKGE